MGGHITSLASLTMALFCILYYLNQRRSLLPVSILSLGLFSMRAKFFVTYAFSILLFSLHKRIKLFNIRILVMSGILIFILINYVIWDKFNLYFIQGTEGDSGVARPLFYITSFKILIDYFPFGSGLASFANNASGIFYSPLYYKYDLWQVWGCTPAYPDFVLGLIVLITILFESVADTMILSNRGVLFFLILGMLRNDLLKDNS